MIFKWIMMIILEVIQSSTHNLPLLLGPQGSARRRNGRDHNSVLEGCAGAPFPKGPTACLFYWGPP